VKLKKEVCATLDTAWTLLAKSPAKEKEASKRRIKDITALLFLLSSGCRPSEAIRVIDGKM
jgi:integrase